MQYRACKRDINERGVDNQEDKVTATSPFSKPWYLLVLTLWTCLALATDRLHRLMLSTKDSSKLNTEQ